MCSVRVDSDILEILKIEGRVALVCLEFILSRGAPTY